MVRGKGFKILWLLYIDPHPPTHPPQKNPHFQGGDSEYYGCERLINWFPWLGEWGSNYYGCNISNSPNNIFRVGILNIMVLRY
jgi:hypothetical protein